MVWQTGSLNDLRSPIEFAPAARSPLAWILLAITPGGTQEPALGHAPVHTGDISEMCRSLFRPLIYLRILLKNLFHRGKAGASPIVGSEGIAAHS